jgi:magnesium transporter
VLQALAHIDGRWVDVDDLSKISDLVEAGTLVWAHCDVHVFDRSDLATIQEELGLHPLAVEDAVNTRQRPKLEAYENHLFAVTHQLDTIDGQLEAKQIACFVGKNWVLTLHDGAERMMKEASSRCIRMPIPEGRGPSFVMHALLDSVVDDYQSIADGIEDEVERIEEDVLADPSSGQAKQIYTVKQRLARFRRYAQPGSRVLATFVDSSQQTIATSETAAYFRDVLDHTLRITDQLRNVEDLVDAMLELRRTEQMHSMTDVSKRLTGWAAIIAVPTFIASVYGMNFELTPHGAKEWGFEFALGLMVTAAVGLYVFFKKRGWI